MERLIGLIPLFPLACAAVNILCGRHLPRRVVSGLAVAGVAAATGLTALLWPLAAGEGVQVTFFSWLASGALQIPVALRFDILSAPMTLMVVGVSTLIHLYAVGYMEQEADGTRFFALLNLFVFAMLVIVLADNLLLLFLGWEMVGFCSYALIGFWYREEENAAAGRKAFLVTRIGDVFFGIALLWSFKLFGTLSIPAINARAGELDPATVTALGLLLLAGAAGKSAQLPLMTWLPDAMAGPTPVSALIHAATMVTAGVYLLCRLFPLVSLSPPALLAIAVVGSVTALYAASCALAQREIKRVLAYSTMSQIGYMFFAVGAGSVAGAMFHLFTHAFFKALLFMAAGCVIHLFGGENDLFRMGGVAKRAPTVFVLFLAGGLCLAGFPLTGGFFSKDAILLAAFAHGSQAYRIFWGLGLITALMTALYTFRLLYLVFAGAPRQTFDSHHLPRTMVWTLVPLALLGLGGGLFNLPAVFGGGEWLGHHLGALAGEKEHICRKLELGLMGLTTVLVLIGWLLARQRYRVFTAGAMGRSENFFLQGWHADALLATLFVRPFRRLGLFFWHGTDRTLIDGLLEGLATLIQTAGEHLRRLTSGRLSHYLLGFAWGLVVILGYYLLRGLVG